MITNIVIKWQNHDCNKIYATLSDVQVVNLCFMLWNFIHLIVGGFQLSKNPRSTGYDKSEETLQRLWGRHIEAWRESDCQIMSNRLPACWSETFNLSKKIYG